MSEATGLRSSTTVGVVPWIVHRVTAILLVVLLAVHVGVQAYGIALVYELGIYRELLDVTLVTVLAHGFLGALATILETRWEPTTKRILIWLFGVVVLLVVGVRLL